MPAVFLICTQMMLMCRAGHAQKNVRYWFEWHRAMNSMSTVQMVLTKLKRVEMSMGERLVFLLSSQMFSVDRDRKS